MVRKFTVFLSALIFLFVLRLGTAQAASLFFSPSSKQVTVGNIVNVLVLVNTQGQPANNSQAIINFPTEMLDAVSISKSGSIFSLWVEEPAFSNQTGTVSFNGGLPTPGYNGVSGSIINISFRVKAAGQATLYFSSASVLANDGLGTEILQSKGQAQFTLTGNTVVPPILAPETANAKGTPGAVKITSTTNPNSDNWYNNPNPVFSWSLERGVSSVRLLYDKNPYSKPTVAYAPPISEKLLSNINDGVYYLHVQQKNSEGWGAVAHFRFQIDSQKPEYLNVKEKDRQDLTDPQVFFTFTATDKGSGIDHYVIQIDSTEAQSWFNDGSNTYQVPILNPGQHSLLVKALDKAGNYSVDSVEFEITALAAPVITKYPESIESNAVLAVKGKTTPNAKVTVWLKKEKQEPISQVVSSDAAGEFNFVVDGNLSQGIYTLWVQAVDNRGAQSKLSEEVNIIVKASAFSQVGTKAINLLAIIVPLAALIAALIFIIWFAWFKFKKFKKKMQKEAVNAETALHQAFQILRNDLVGHVSLLEDAKTKRPLTEEEKKIVKRLKKDLDHMEQFVVAEIKVIEKDSK